MSVLKRRYNYKTVEGRHFLRVLIVSTLAIMFIGIGITLSTPAEYNNTIMSVIIPLQVFVAGFLSHYISDWTLPEKRRIYQIDRELDDLGFESSVTAGGMEAHIDIGKRVIRLEEQRDELVEYLKTRV